MSRFQSFTQFNGKMGSDIETIVNDKPIIVSVYRRTAGEGANPGFDEEVGELNEIGKIKARIDTMKQSIFANLLGTDAGHKIEEKYIGLTIDTKIQPLVGDIWRAEILNPYEGVPSSEDYKVASIEARYDRYYVVALIKGFTYQI